VFRFHSDNEDACRDFGVARPPALRQAAEMNALSFDFAA